MLPINKKSILQKIKNAPFDPAVGIQIALLWEDLNKSYYCSLISPHKKLAAHYHNEGDELYFIIEGNGLMRLGTQEATGIEWKQEFEVAGGDFFTVPPQVVHQLINQSDENLLAIFGCDKNHLGSDRFIIKE